MSGRLIKGKTEMEFEVIVIGSGPGGYTSAIRASQLGAKVAVIEKGELGGVCLNSGCIPAKTLIASADFYSKLNKAKEFGVNANGIKIDYPAVIERKEKIIKKLRTGIAGLFKSYNIELIKGNAVFANPNQINVSGQVVSFKKCIIATGSQTIMLPNIKVDGNTVLTSTELLSLKQIPSSLLVIGGGVIGIEFASLFNQLGSKVTVVELLPRILATEDEEISQVITKILKSKGVEILTGSKLVSISGNNAHIEKPDGKAQISAEKILLCVGRKPVYDGLGLEKAGILIENGRIKVNEKMETNVSGIYAIGDAVSKYLLAYVASAEGIVAAENAYGVESAIDYGIIPTCIFTHPEISKVGLTELEAKEKGYKIKIGRFPFMASGRAMILDETEGMVKTVADEKTNAVLGVHIIGPSATEIIHTPAMAIKMEVTTEEFIRIIFSHPSLSEAILESVHDAHKQAIDLPKK